jgi:hypothetical protein
MAIKHTLNQVNLVYEVAYNKLNQINIAYSKIKHSNMVFTTVFIYLILKQK